MATRKVSKSAVRFALDLYRPSGVPFSRPASSLIDQALVREESAEASGKFADAAGHRFIRHAVEQMVFDWDGAL